MVSFSETVKDISYGGEVPNGVDNAVKLAGDIADVAASIPHSGFGTKLFNQSDLAEFARDFKEELGPALVSFASTVADIKYGGEVPNGVDNAMKLSNDLKDLANAVPKSEFWSGN